MAIRTALVIFVALLAGFLAPATASAEEAMTKARAAAYYKKHACNMHQAQVRFSKTVWGGKQTIYPDEIDADLPKYTKAAARMSNGHYRWATRLYNPPKAWPASVRGRVGKLAAVNARASAVMDRVSEAQSGQQWVNRYNRIEGLPWGNHATFIRTKLGVSKINNKTCAS